MLSSRYLTNVEGIPVPFSMVCLVLLYFSKYCLLVVKLENRLFVAELCVDYGYVIEYCK